jgi:hypothetical protein
MLFFMYPTVEWLCDIVASHPSTVDWLLSTAAAASKPFLGTSSEFIGVHLKLSLSFLLTWVVEGARLAKQF